MIHADKVLKGKYRRRNIGAEGKQEEPVWFTDEIRSRIKERRKYNRLQRKARKEENKGGRKVEEGAPGTKNEDSKINKDSNDHG